MFETEVINRPLKVSLRWKFKWSFNIIILMIVLSLTLGVEALGGGRCALQTRRSNFSETVSC